MRLAHRFVYLAFPVALAGLVSCSDDSSSPPPADAGPDSSDGRTYPYRVPDAPCEIIIDRPALQPAAPHLAWGATTTYNSNPPSSGLHYPVWAAFKEFTTPVDRRYYVHDLEHGAVVFVYNCGDGGPCSEATDLFRAAVASLADDPICTSNGEGIRVRTVITPDPLLDVPIAATAWGYTYKARCAHPASLQEFAREHYGHGPERICGDGQPSF